MVNTRERFNLQEFFLDRMKSGNESQYQEYIEEKMIN